MEDSFAKEIITSYEMLINGCIKSIDLGRDIQKNKELIVEYGKVLSEFKKQNDIKDAVDIKEHREIQQTLDYSGI